MIWSRADSWDHNARLPAAAWQIQKEGASDTGRLLQTASAPFISFNYFKLGFRKQLRQGGKTTCLRINSQWNAKWTQRYIFRCFLKGWQPFKGAAARGENVPELKQPSFQITVSWLQLWIQGKTLLEKETIYETVLFHHLRWTEWSPHLHASLDHESNFHND